MFNRGVTSSVRAQDSRLWRLVRNGVPGQGLGWLGLGWLGLVVSLPVLTARCLWLCQKRGDGEAKALDHWPLTLRQKRSILGYMSPDRKEGKQFEEQILV